MPGALDTGGFGRNSESSGGGHSPPGNSRSARSLLIVPRSRLDLYKPLKRSFDDHAKVQVILDRRFRDRRGQSAAARDPERRRADRRRRAHLDTDLRAGRWVTIPVPPSRLDFADPDTRAILFLYCGEHVVGCGNCLMTYRLRCVPRTDACRYSCPRCTTYMTPAVCAHTQTS